MSKSRFYFKKFVICNSLWEVLKKSLQKKQMSHPRGPLVGGGGGVKSKALHTHKTKIAQNVFQAI